MHRLEIGINRLENAYYALHARPEVSYVLLLDHHYPVELGRASPSLLWRCQPVHEAQVVTEEADNPIDRALYWVAEQQRIAGIVAGGGRLVTPVEAQHRHAQRGLVIEDDS